MYVEKTCDVDEVLLDGERIVTVEVGLFKPIEGEWKVERELADGP